MSITIETRYRITADGTVIELDEDAARRLVEDLAARLPYSDQPARGVAYVEQPHIAPIPIAALPATTEPAPPRGRSGAPTWTEADTKLLEQLAAEGYSRAKIVQRMEKPASVVDYQAKKRGIRMGTQKGPTTPAAKVCEPPAVPAPTPTPPARPPPAPSVPRSDADADWTPAQTKALIAVMARGKGLREAMTQTGHSFLSCERRWRHLKEAGPMTIERYVSSQESILKEAAGG